MSGDVWGVKSLQIGSIWPNGNLLWWDFTCALLSGTPVRKELKRDR